MAHNWARWLPLPLGGCPVLQSGGKSEVAHNWARWLHTVQTAKFCERRIFANWKRCEYFVKNFCVAGQIVKKVFLRFFCEELAFCDKKFSPPGQYLFKFLRLISLK